MNVTSTRGKTIIIEGGQYGSEGKGQIAAAVARDEGVWGAVRTGSINAGHTVYHNGHKCSMQIIPTPWIHRNIMLILGPGCYIEPAILRAEVEMIQKITGENVRDRLLIDYRCSWFGDEERLKSQAANRHHAMGATGKGCSEAIVTKMRDRGSDNPAWRQFSQYAKGEYTFTDTVAIVNRQLKSGHNILLEGTQGALLDFNCGPYPFVTSRMTSSAAWLAEAGLPPVNVETCLVVRSHPIRVAGNSGPMPEEISWPILAEQVNAKLGVRGQPPMVDPVALSAFKMALVQAVHNQFPEVVQEIGPERACKFHLWSEAECQQFRVCLSEANTIAFKSLPADVQEALKFFEMTTVTKKLRRIANLSISELQRACDMNAPTYMAYTFLNYDLPTLWGSTDESEVSAFASDLLGELEMKLNLPVRYATTERTQDHVIKFF